MINETEVVHWYMWGFGAFVMCLGFLKDDAEVLFAIRLVFSVRDGCRLFGRMVSCWRGGVRLAG
jgi:hypothetical protein